MADEDNRLHGELEALQEQALPAARAQVVLRQRELRIASLQGQIAQADADLARSLSAAMREFQLERFLSAEFWAKLAALMKRVMRRYLELGARCAWLAERALAYEQDRSINIVRFDYFPAQLQGVTGADLLKMDLDELEAARLAGLKQTVPIKRTYSLALDFPLAFGQLKKTGRCTFRTEEKPFRLAYPGLYGYRIRAISLEVRSAAAISQARGMLVNEGASLVSRSDGKSHALMRFSEAAPISEFHLKDDMAVYGLPDECLFSFEGSGVDTYWTLEFPLTANPYGLDPVADILITLDLRASYSSDLHEKHLTALPKTVRRMILLSARKQQPKALEELRSGHSPVTLSFDLAGLGLPRHETAKKIANLVILLAGVEAPKVEAELRWGPTQSKVDFKFARGKAFSKGKPLLNPHTESSKLDKLLGKDLEGSCELLIDPAANPSVNFTRLKDVVLCVEYTAHY